MIFIRLTFAIAMSLVKIGISFSQISQTTFGDERKRRNSAYLRHFASVSIEVEALMTDHDLVLIGTWEVTLAMISK
jgi:hypothetical protein